MQLVRGYLQGRVAQAVALTAGTGGRTPEFDALADPVVRAADTLMFVGFAATFFALALLIISAARRHWSKLHSAAVVLVAAGVLLGTLLV